LRLKVIKRGPNDLEIEIEGEGHTFCNVLRKELYEDKAVVYAGYTIDHPLVGIPRFYVRTDGSESPEEALLKAAQRIAEKAREFREQFKEAVRGYREKRE